jgi:hypothetical protein
MKATESLASAVVAISVLASNAFALIKSPYPRRTSAPDTIIVTTDDGHDLARSTVRVSK